MAAVASLALSLGGGTVATAAAAVSVVITPTFPAAVSVGDQGVATSLQLRNVSDGANASDSLRVDSIFFTPSCGQQGLGFTCPAGSEDPGVFQPSAFAVGRAGTACAGISFSITLVDAPTGRYVLSPSTQLVLGPQAVCTIDFTVNVLKVPTKDAAPATPGVQTAMIATVTATDLTPPSAGITAGSVGTRTTNVLRAVPAISTQVSSSSISLGQSFTDTAVITKPAAGPAVTGTVNFNVYGPGDSTCSGAPVFSSLNRPVTGGTATSGVFTPTAPGVYRVIAVYNGDANYAPVADVCGAANESVVVSSAPTVTTGLPNSVGNTTASLSGTVNPNGVATTFTFEFGTSTAFGSITTPTSAGAGTSPLSVTANLSGLAPNTTYFYRLVATNSSGVTSTGIVRSFRTTGTASPPVALTGAASAITTSGATLNGQVNPRGSQTAYTFEYGTSTAFGSLTPVVALDNADALEPVSATLTGLAPNTTYFYRTVATNAAGTTAGPVSAFSTGPGGVPVVATGAATGVTATSATLNGTVNANGSQTAYTFEYGTTNAFGSISAVESAGSVSGANPFALPITGLSPNTTYLYRIVATNANGTATGQIASFQTAPAPPPPQPSA